MCITFSSLIYTETAGYHSPAITLNTLWSRSMSFNLHPNNTDTYMTFHDRIFYFKRYYVV